MKVGDSISRTFHGEPQPWLRVERVSFGGVVVVNADGSDMYVPFGLIDTDGVRRDLNWLWRAGDGAAS